MPVLVHELNIPALHMLTHLTAEECLSEVDVHAFANPPENIRIAGRFGQNCRIIARKGMRFPPNAIQIGCYDPEGCSNITIIFLGHPGSTSIVLRGSNNTLLFAQDTWNFHSRINVRNDSSLFVGEGCVSGGSRIELSSSDVTIGKGCLFADETLLQSCDGHGIVDLESMRITNEGRGSIDIGAHVWIGRRATLLKGVHVGNGSIIANASVVTRDVAACTLVAGVPAKAIKTGVSWSHNPSSIAEAEQTMFAEWMQDQDELQAIDKVRLAG